jgi:hypothetical protein
MFVSIISQLKFWRSVLVLAFGFAFIFIVIKGLVTQELFSQFFESWRNILGLILGSTIYGFFAAYSKFYRHYKRLNRSK